MKIKKYYLSGLKCEDCKKAVQRFFYEDSNVLKVKISDDLKVVDLKFKEPKSFRDLRADFINYFDGKYSINRINSSVSEYLYLSTILVFLLIGSFFGSKLFDLNFMNTYMGVYLIVFGIFKLIDLNGFVESFRMYDPIAKRSYKFALAYPFFELLFGFLYFSFENLFFVNSLVLILFLVNSVGVVKVLKSNSKIRCACSGTFFRLNLSILTLLENFLMVGMSFYMILY